MSETLSIPIKLSDLGFIESVPSLMKLVLFDKLTELIASLTSTRVKATIGHNSWLVSNLLVKLNETEAAPF